MLVNDDMVRRHLLKIESGMAGLLKSPCYNDYQKLCTKTALRKIRELKKTQDIITSEYVREQCDDIMILMCKIRDAKYSDKSAYSGVKIERILHYLDMVKKEC